MPGILEEFRQYRSLLKHFFAGFFDNDWISRKEDMGAALAPIFGLVAVPGLMIPLLLYPLYSSLASGPPLRRDPVLWTHMSFYVAFSMLVMGLASVVEWDALFPDIRDYRILTPLPVRLRTLFAAKFLALLFFVLFFAAMANAGSSVMFPLTLGALGGSMLRFILGHAAALFGVAVFTFCFLVALQGAAMNVLSYRWFRRISPLLQLSALIAVLLGFFLFPKMSAMLDPRQVRLHPALLWYPPAWFLGLYVTVIGQAGPAMRRLAETAVWALGAGGVACILAYTLSYWRHVRRSLETAPAATDGPGPLQRALVWLADRVLLRHPLERASFYFMARTLVRSRRHRLVLATYAGLGVALALDSLSLMILRLSHPSAARPSATLLSIQLVLSFFVLCGLRYSFTIPTELRANWVFQATESDEGRRHIQAAKKLLAVFGALPPLAVLFPLHLALWGWRIALLHAAYSLVLALLLAELLLANFSKIPFTCSYVPGKANVRLLAFGYFLAFFTYAYYMASLEARLLTDAGMLMYFCGTLVAGLAAWNLGTAFWRRATSQRLTLIFDDEPEPAVRTLNLMS